MRRMTPAKLLVLMDKQMSRLAIQELPIAAFQCLFYNMHRSPGNEKEGIAAAPVKQVKDFQVFNQRSKKTLAAKDDKPGGRHVHDGAKANRQAWTAWAGKNAKPRVIKERRDGRV